MIPNDNVCCIHAKQDSFCDRKQKELANLTTSCWRALHEPRSPEVLPDKPWSITIPGMPVDLAADADDYPLDIGQAGFGPQASNVTSLHTPGSIETEPLQLPLSTSASYKTEMRHTTKTKQ